MALSLLVAGGDLVVVAVRDEAELLVLLYFFKERQENYGGIIIPNFTLRSTLQQSLH